jgi:hypothetical protein
MNAIPIPETTVKLFKGAIHEYPAGNTTLL